MAHGKGRFIAFAFLAFCFASPSQAVFFAGELSTTDALAEDPGWGNFYYDLYYVVVNVPMTMHIFMTPTDPFVPWLGYWDGDFSGTPDFDTPPAEDYVPDNGILDRLHLAFDALPGIEYQIMAATYYYNPTELGNYNFFVFDPESTNTGFTASTSPILTTQSVPAPASWIILGLGLLALSLTKRVVGTATPAFVRC